jgi:hypothetical protein
MTQSLGEQNRGLGDLKYYPRRAFNNSLGLFLNEGQATHFRLAYAKLGRDPIGDEGYKKLASELLGLDNVSAPEAKYAVNYTEALDRAVDLRYPKFFSLNKDIKVEQPKTEVRT